MPSMTLAWKVKDLRTQRGMSQNELADAIGVDRSYVSHIESGRIRQPSADVLKGLARALGVPPSELALAIVGASAESPSEPEPSADEPPIFRELDRDRHVKPETRRIVRMIVEADYRAWQEEQARKKGES
jgi:transcriptional regulator with XRE-family HTH domain